ncbi:hypothetical protein [Streptomyces sp. 4F14]|uniref:hypothetical protein n=1 Tax=Streptomyces sp. 4F14 TaxID=3394380 RepID=UPI003A855E3C
MRLRVLPIAVGHGVSTDGSLPRFDLTGAQLKELAHGLYNLLARFEGYRTAMVDWDPESFLDVDDLAELWSEDLSEGTLPGLVIAEHFRTRLPLGPAWVPFSPGYLWLPHEQ